MLLKHRWVTKIHDEPNLAQNSLCLAIEPKLHDSTSELLGTQCSTVMHACIECLAAKPNLHDSTFKFPCMQHSHHARSESTNHSLNMCTPGSDTMLILPEDFKQSKTISTMQQNMTCHKCSLLMLISQINTVLTYKLSPIWTS